MRMRALLMTVATLLMAAPARAAVVTVHVADPWIRFVTPETPAAGYFVVTNAGSRPVVITGASSPNCASVMLHQSRSVNGVEEMNMVSSVTVPPHGEVRFQPGGYHLMCTAPKDMKLGTRVPISLRFEDNRIITRGFLVRGVNRK
jgi:periplasmic copper chaperone A